MAHHENVVLQQCFAHLLQMKEAGVMFAEALVPTARAAGRTPGDFASPSYEGGVGEGESKGLIQDLGETAEAALQAVVHQRDAHPGTRPAGVLRFDLVLMNRPIHALGAAV